MQKVRNTRVMDMTEGSAAKLLFAFALPIFLGNLFQQFYNLADTAIAGHLLGDGALAQIGAHNYRICLWPEYRLCSGGKPVFRRR